jgi:hypothetical protein
MDEQKDQQKNEKGIEKEEGITLRPIKETTPMIKEEDINAVIRLSDNTCIWSKLVDGGFKFDNQDKIIPELVGRLVEITPYLINFDSAERPPPKLPHVESDLEIPPGYHRRTDIKMEIANSGGNVIGLSLPLSSAKFQLSPYLRHLKNQGLKPHEVVTRITSRQASNPSGTFSVAVFHLIDHEDDPSGSPPDQGVSALPPEWQ